MIPKRSKLGGKGKRRNKLKKNDKKRRRKNVKFLA